MLPEDFLAREWLMSKIQSIFRSFGYDPIETPVIEFTRVLSGEDETSKNIFFVSTNSQSQKEALAMRFDHTVPFARLLAAYPYNRKKKTGIRLPWRRMVLGPVFRADPPQEGRYRQFYQCDIDVAGTESMLADAEIVFIIYKVMCTLVDDDFVIRLNNRKILNGLISLLNIQGNLNVSVDDLTREIMRTLDKLEKVGEQEVFELLRRQPDNEFDPAPNLDEDSLEIIKRFLTLNSTDSNKLEQCRQILFTEEGLGQQGIDELKMIQGYLEKLGVPSDKVVIDFSIARGLDYYTGPVMETTILSRPQLGSVFSGGRYDDLINRFTGQKLPAVGASIGVDRLFHILKQLNLLPENRTTVTDVMILNLSDKCLTSYLDLSRQLRQIGLNVEMCLVEDQTFQSQFNFAVSRGAKFVIIFGEDELLENVAQIKNLVDRSQLSVPYDNIVDFFENSIK